MQHSATAAAYVQRIVGAVASDVAGKRVGCLPGRSIIDGNQEILREKQEPLLISSTFLKLKTSGTDDCDLLHGVWI